MAKPTFNIQDLVAPVGRSPADPFTLPTLAEQNKPKKPTPVVPPPKPQQPSQYAP